MLIDGRRYSRAQWPKVLELLTRASVRDRQTGTPALARTRVRYKREPRGRERWQSAESSHALGEADCEDLAAWLAADFRVRGIDARVVTKKTSTGYHALVLAKIRGKTLLLDPSRVRGMNRKAES